MPVRNTPAVGLTYDDKPATPHEAFDGALDDLAGSYKQLIDAYDEDRSVNPAHRANFSRAIRSMNVALDAWAEVHT